MLISSGSVSKLVFAVVIVLDVAQVLLFIKLSWRLMSPMIVDGSAEPIREVRYMVWNETTAVTAIRLN